MTRQRVKVEWVETTRYEKVFRLDTEGVDLSDLSSIHEAMDEQSAWDQVKQKEWLGEAILGVEDREVDKAALAGP